MNYYSVGPNRTILFGDREVPNMPNFNQEGIDSEILDDIVEGYVNDLNSRIENGEPIPDLLPRYSFNDGINEGEDEEYEDEGGHDWDDDDSNERWNSNPFNEDDVAAGLRLTDNYSDIEWELHKYRDDMLRYGHDDLAINAKFMIEHCNKNGEVTELMLSTEEGPVDSWTGFHIIVRDGKVLQDSIYVDLTAMRDQIEVRAEREHFLGRPLNDYLVKHFAIAQNKAAELGFSRVDAVFSNEGRVGDRKVAVMTSCVALDTLGRRHILINNAPHREGRVDAETHAKIVGVFAKMIANQPAGMDQVRRITVSTNAPPVFENAIGERLNILPVENPMQEDPAPGM